jgi:hypothetical protein
VGHFFPICGGKDEGWSGDVGVARGESLRSSFKFLVMNFKFKT